MACWVPSPYSYAYNANRAARTGESPHADAIAPAPEAVQCPVKAPPEPAPKPAKRTRRTKAQILADQS